MALHQRAWQSSTVGSFTADKAVDGRYTNLTWDGGQCATSAWAQTTQWQVDLGGVKNIHHVFLQYATGNELWGIVSFKLIHSISIYPDVLYIELLLN